MVETRPLNEAKQREGSACLDERFKPLRFLYLALVSAGRVDFSLKLSFQFEHPSEPRVSADLTCL